MEQAIKEGTMRTTIDIELDVLNQAKELASLEKLSLGAMVSRLLRERFTFDLNGAVYAKQNKAPYEFIDNNGFATIPKAGRKVTLEQIKKIRDAEGI
jgi:hypothetical protein